jgi:hypothetical protein
LHKILLMNIKKWLLYTFMKPPKKMVGSRVPTQLINWFLANVKTYKLNIHNGFVGTKYVPSSLIDDVQARNNFQVQVSLLEFTKFS